MRRFLFLLVMLTSTAAIAQWETIKGSGNVTKETREVGNFSGIKLYGSMNVFVTYGKPGSVTVEADDNLIPLVETIVENGQLVVRMKKKMNIRSRTKLRVYVTANTLNHVAVSGSGNIQGDGRFETNGKSSINVAGSGNINLTYAGLEDASIAISGSGNINLKGKSARRITATTTGSGNIDASEIAAGEVMAQTSGSGNIRINATNSLEAKTSGSGNIFYKGGATKVNAKANGSGKVIKV